MRWGVMLHRLAYAPVRRVEGGLLATMVEFQSAHQKRSLGINSKVKVE